MGPKKKSGAQNRAAKAVKDALSQKNSRTLKDCAGWIVQDKQSAVPALPTQVLFLQIDSHGFRLYMLGYIIFLLIDCLY